MGSSSEQRSKPGLVSTSVVSVFPRSFLLMSHVLSAAGSTSVFLQDQVFTSAAYKNIFILLVHRTAAASRPFLLFTSRQKETKRVGWTNQEMYCRCVFCAPTAETSLTSLWVSDRRNPEPWKHSYICRYNCVFMFSLNCHNWQICVPTELQNFLDLPNLPEMFHEP